jgi:hypothetical protein
MIFASRPLPLGILLLAILLVGCHPYRPATVTYRPAEAEMKLPFAYADPDNNQVLQTLRDRYGLEELLVGARNDQERALRLLDWTNQRWNHHGHAVAEKMDALSILEGAEKGTNYRCVEYSVVAASAFAAMGMPARAVGLKKQNAATNRTRGGHVVAEVWLEDEGKWALVDGEFNIMPILDGKPLNAVELKQALQEKKPIQYTSMEGPAKMLKRKNYRNFIHPYLYFIDTRFDQRKLADNDDVITYEGTTRVMLLPDSAGRLETFERNTQLTGYTFTKSVGDFYTPPFTSK